MSILTIAGSDPSGGAGISADIKTAHSLSFHACPVISAITFQNTCEVKGVRPLNEVIKGQLDSVLNDIRIDAVKIGMIYDQDCSDIIAGSIRDIEVPRILDPVIEATSGYTLGSGSAYFSLMEICTVITPNAGEMGMITGVKVEDVLSAEKATKELIGSYPDLSTVITGVRGKDVIWDSQRNELFILGNEENVKQVHGTGCVYSTALACFLSGMKNETDRNKEKEIDLVSACNSARELVTEARRDAFNVGKCLPVVNP